MEGSAVQAPDHPLRKLDEFVATLGHELRNGLAAIRNAAQLLSVEGVPEHDQRLSREVILRQSGLLAHLVDKLLDASHMKPGDKLPLGGVALEADSARLIQALARELARGSDGAVEPPPVGTGHRLAHPQPDPHAWHPWYRLRVLVVDDNTDAAHVLGLLIGSLGFKAHAVTDGREVADAVAAFKPRTVFLDLDMPGMDGYEIARRLREQPFGAHLRLIAVSGWGEDSKPPSADTADFNHYLTKPVEPDALMRILFGPAPVDGEQPIAG